MTIHHDNTLWLVNERNNEMIAQAERDRQAAKVRSGKPRRAESRPSPRRAAGHALIRLGARLADTAQTPTFART